MPSRPRASQNARLGKNFCQTGEAVFVHTAQSLAAYSKNAFGYDKARRADCKVYYIHSDQLNTPRVITDAGNNVVWEWKNTEAFGANLPNENPAGLGTFTYNPRFAGQYFDSETGLHYNYFRDYDPATGRYVESDPIGLGGGVNTYAYVYNQPTHYADLFGLDAKCGPGMKAVPDPRNPGGQVSSCIPDPSEDPGKKICTTAECSAGVLPRTNSDPDACHLECSDGAGKDNMLCGLLGSGAGLTPIPGVSFVVNKACRKVTKDECVKKCEERNEKQCKAK